MLGQFRSVEIEARKEVAKTLHSFVNRLGIRLAERELLLDALERVQKTGIHLVDAYLARRDDGTLGVDDASDVERRHAERLEGARLDVDLDLTEDAAEDRRGAEPLDAREVFLARKGLRRAPEASARDFASQVAAALPDSGGQAFAAITEAYLAERFGGRACANQREQLASLQDAVDRMGLRDQPHIR